jgi:hypothetical protein
MLCRQCPVFIRLFTSPDNQLFFLSQQPVNRCFIRYSSQNVKCFFRHPVCRLIQWHETLILMGFYKHKTIRSSILGPIVQTLVDRSELRYSF